MECHEGGVRVSETDGPTASRQCDIARIEYPRPFERSVPAEPRRESPPRLLLTRAHLQERTLLQLFRLRWLSRSSLKGLSVGTPQMSGLIHSQGIDVPLV